jgi:autotransporter passenger strand-loop-strand repeat protein
MTNYVVSAGASSGNIVLAAGDSLTISGGGTATSTTVSSGAEMVTNAGGVASRSLVLSGAIELNNGLTTSSVLSGGVQFVALGTALDTQVYAGGFEFTDFGISRDTVIHAGGVERASGTAIGTVVENGGLLQAQGVVSGTVVQAAGLLLVSSGGSARATDLQAGGVMVLLAGASASLTSGTGFTISTGTVALPVGGGFAINPASATLTSGGTEYVLSGGTNRSSVIEAGAVQLVQDGVAVSAVIAGLQSVTLGGTASATVVAGGMEIVASGVALGTVVDGGTMLVEAAGAAQGVTVAGGAAVLAGGTASAVTVSAGGDFVVQAGTASAVTIASGGNAYLAGGTLAGVTLGSGGVFEIASGTLAGAVIFGTSGGTLYVEAPVSGAVLSNFAAGAVIDLPNLASGTATLTGETLAVTDGTTTYNFDLVGDAGMNLATAPDSGAGTLVAIPALCFCAGTRIATPGGERRVETLAIGEAVNTTDGPRWIKWIGVRRYAATTHPDLVPVEISAGAIADGVPKRALLVSPGHGIAIEDGLFAAGRLVNGRSVRQPARAADIWYVHIELEGHALVFAEGCLAETFLDEAQREIFDNAAEFAALYPGPVVPKRPCLMRHEEGFLLASVQRRLAARAGVPATVPVLGALRGFVDVLGGGRVAGWAQNVAQPEEAVTLDICVNGVPVRRVLANGFRADLRAVGIGSGCHAFSLVLPHRGVVSVRRTEDGAVLAVDGRATRAA